MVCSVVNVGFRLRWKFVVFVKVGLEDRPIEGPREALKFLRETPGIRTGYAYWNAVSACSGALRYRCDMDVARMSFISAHAHWQRKYGH
ncbi:DUF982 domain-containing protein [Neorhizobium huautlense]|uniref:DUF982 domain-containing protein n=1 Tax=Neorhizobium huautlense TaxID=67774 RepID=UPI00359455E4